MDSAVGISACDALHNVSFFVKFGGYEIIDPYVSTIGPVESVILTHD
jgi:hypothetical protein